MSSSSPDGAAPVQVIDRDQLRAKLAHAGEQPFKLVMAASDFGFRAKHIPGSLHVKERGDTYAALGKHDDIVVYCSNLDCHASRAVVKELVSLGYTRVSHYEGGLLDWEAAGLPLEGDWANDPARQT
jgi:rhodanese-related sulfurtransferase